jgi:maleate isomerase
MPDRYGPRGVFAIMIPQQNSVQQPEYEAMRPSGVSNQIYRFELESQDDVAAAVLRAIPGAQGCWPDMIVGGNSLEMRDWSLERQARYREELRERAGGVPVVNATDATEAALRKVGARRIGMFVPLYERTLQSAAAYWEAVGFEVARRACMGIEHPRYSINIGLPEIAAVFERIDGDDIDTLVHIGGSLGIGDMIEPLEAKFGKPVLSVNQNAYWYALRTHGIADPVPGFGRLLREPSIG